MPVYTTSRVTPPFSRGSPLMPATAYPPGAIASAGIVNWPALSLIRHPASSSGCIVALYSSIHSPAASATTPGFASTSVTRTLPGVASSPSKMHAGEQPSPATALPSSHSSPTSSTPLPHANVGPHALGWPAHAQPASTAHADEQPSPEVTPPSSHASPASTTPSPHVAICTSPTVTRLMPAVPP